MKIQELMKDKYLQQSKSIYLSQEKKLYEMMDEQETRVHLISEINYQKRHNYLSCDQLGVNIRTGDICFADFGRAYLQESGFQHFCLIVSFCKGKAFVIPMTSNPATYNQGFHPQNNPLGKSNLLQIGLVEGMNRPSVLFLNDAKFINTARIIDVKAHVSPRDELFQLILQRLRICLKL